MCVCERERELHESREGRQRVKRPPATRWEAESKAAYCDLLETETDALEERRSEREMLLKRVKRVKRQT